MKVLSHREDTAVSGQLWPQLAQFPEAREGGLLHDNVFANLQRRPHLVEVQPRRNADQQCVVLGLHCLLVAPEGVMQA